MIIADEITGTADGSVLSLCGVNAFSDVRERTTGKDRRTARYGEPRPVTGNSRVTRLDPQSPAFDENRGILRTDSSLERVLRANENPADSVLDHRTEDPVRVSRVILRLPAPFFNPSWVLTRSCPGPGTFSPKPVALNKMYAE